MPQARETKLKDIISDVEGTWGRNVSKVYFHAYFLPTTHYQLRTTHYSPPTTHHSPLTTHHSPLTTHHSLPTTHD